MKKRLFIFLFITCLCMLILISTNRGLDSIKDTLLIGYETRMDSSKMQNVHELAVHYKSVLQSSLYTTRQSTVNSFNKKIEDITTYLVDGRYQDFYPISILEGRFIWDRDIKENQPYVVIEKQDAEALFATTKCIGKTVFIGEDEYTIIGVYQNSNTLLNQMSSIHKKAVYIPLKSTWAEALSFKILLRTQSNTAFIMIPTIQKVLGSILNANTPVNLNNLDFEARKCQQKIKLTYMFMILIFMIYALRWILPTWRSHIKNIREQIQTHYLREALRKSTKTLMILLGTLLLFVVTVILLWSALKFQLLIDPKLIPEKLIDLEEIKTKLIDYFVSFNTEKPVISFFKAYITHANTITNITGLLSLGSFYMLIQLLFRSMIRIRKNT